MAKKKNQTAPTDIRDTVGSVMHNTIQLLREKLEDPFVCSAAEASAALGIRMPFPMEYLLQVSTLPLERLIMLVGSFGCNKSAMASEIIRWFLNAGGIGAIIENENKPSVSFAHAIIGWPDEMERKPAWTFMRARSVQDWQQRLNTFYDTIRTNMNKAPAPGRKPVGRTFPVVAVLDSLSGSLSEGTIGNIDEAGYASRAHPEEALLNTQFLKKIPHDLQKWPFSLVVVNHLKKRKAEHGHGTVRGLPGGSHCQFQESFELELSKDSRGMHQDTDAEAVALTNGYNRINITCYKNSAGQDRLEIDVNLRWCYRNHPTTGVARQYAAWDWDVATVDLLAKLSEGRLSSRVSEVVDIRQAKKDRYWSKRMGVSEESPVTAGELGQMIQESHELRRDLRNLLGIQRTGLFEAGTDYHELLEARLNDPTLGDFVDEHARQQGESELT